MTAESRNVLVSQRDATDICEALVRTGVKFQCRPSTFEVQDSGKRIITVWGKKDGSFLSFYYHIQTGQAANF